MGQSLKVLLYKDAPANPDGIPGDWPAAANALGEGEQVAPPWIEMTPEAYALHRAEHQAEYDAWAAGVEAAAYRQRLGELIKQRAYELETGGMVVNGSRVNTDRSDQSMVGNALSWLTLNPEETIQFQQADNTFVQLGLAQIQGLASAMGAHVQAHFLRRGELFAELAETEDADLPAFEAKVRKFWEDE